MSSGTKVWFITGCSSGFGLAITEHALKKGDKVVATLREPKVLSELAARHPERLLVLRLDVTKPTEMIAAFAASKEKFGRIDVVVNNAGFGVIAEVEGMTESTARDMFEVNFWGASYVSKEAIRFFREENKPMGGRLLQVSSSGGITPTVGFVHYCASKFALEGLSEGLARELDPIWNIKVTILEPGPFRTIVGRRQAQAPANAMTTVHPAYTNPLLPTMKLRSILTGDAVDQLFNGDPDKFAVAVYKAAYLDDPPLRLPLHHLSVNIFREKGKQLLETAEKWGSWSEDILIKE